MLEKLKNYNLYIIYSPNFYDEQIFNLNTKMEENDKKIKELQDIVQEMQKQIDLTNFKNKNKKENNKDEGKKE